MGVDDGRLAGRGQVLARAGRQQAALLEVLDGLGEAGGALVADVVVRHAHDIEAGLGDAVDERSGRRRRSSPTCATGSGSAPGSRSSRARCRRSEIRSRIAPAFPVRPSVGTFHPNDEQQTQARDVGGPAIEREVRTLALVAQDVVDAAVEHDVAAREQGPRRRCIEGFAGGRLGQSGTERPVGRVRHAIDAEERLAAPGQRPHLRPDRVGAQECEPLAVLARGRRRASSRPSPRSGATRRRAARRRVRRGSRRPRP